MRALRARTAIAGLFTVLLLLGAGCASGGGDDQTGGGSAGADTTTATTAGGSGGGDTAATSDLHEALPQAIKDAGEIVFAGDSHPPYRVVEADGETITGIDPDIQAALGAALGVDTRIEVVAGLPPALSGMLSGRFDAFNGPVKDTAEREQQFDIIVYMTTRTSYLIPTASSAGIETSDDLCGKKIAGTEGSIVADQIAKLSEYCQANGMPPAEMVGLAETNDTILAAKAGRADAAAMTQTAALYAMQQEPGTYDYVTQTDEQGAGIDQLGMLVPKSSGLGPVILDAFKELFANGEYQRIMEEWGLTDVMVDEPRMNVAESS